MKEIIVSEYSSTIQNLKYEVANRNRHAMNVLGAYYEKIGDTYLTEEKDEAYRYYKMAFDYYHQAASLHSPEGQYNVARLHYENKMDKPNISTAVKYLNKASKGGSYKAEQLLKSLHSLAETSLYASKEKAENGSMKEQYSLAKIYEQGLNGVKKDLRQAVYWYKKAASNGNRYAQYSLGLYYRDGVVVEQDYEEAAKWFTLSSNKGYSKAKFSLAKLYYAGKGVPLDKEECYKLLSQASLKGYKLAQRQLDRLGRQA